MGNYSDLIKLNAPADKVFDALTNKIPLWWTEMFEGSANNKNDTFTVRFGETIYKTILVKEITNNLKIVWSVTDSLINIPELKNQTEWIGTSIEWEIIPQGSKTELLLTHIGLRPDIECYDICTTGWKQFTNSLKLFLETGNGNPFKQ